MAKSGITGFICAHIALILFIVSLAGQQWVIGNTTNTSNVTANETCHKGLWYSNCGKPSTSVINNQTEVALYYRLSQFFYPFSALNLLVSVFLSYTLLCCKSCNANLCCNGFITAIQGIATLECAVALALVGIGFNSPEENTFPAEYKYLNLGWTYWVAVATGGMVFFATMFTATSAKDKVKNNRKQREYERV